MTRSCCLCWWDISQQPLGEAIQPSGHGPLGLCLEPAAICRILGPESFVRTDGETPILGRGMRAIEDKTGTRHLHSTSVPFQMPFRWTLPIADCLTVHMHCIFFFFPFLSFHFPFPFSFLLHFLRETKI